MKEVFDDGSFIEFKIGSPGHIAIVMAARDSSNHLKLIVNSKEITLQSFSNLVAGIGLQLPPPKKE